MIIFSENLHSIYKYTIFVACKREIITNFKKSEIMNNSKEIYELMAMFEENATKFFNVTSDFTKEDKSLWSKRIYYTNGEINNVFIAYMFGYSFGKSV